MNKEGQVEMWVDPETGTSAQRCIDGGRKEEEYSQEVRLLDDIGLSVESEAEDAPIMQVYAASELIRIGERRDLVRRDRS